MTLPDHFMFSQSSLQDYVDCPRRFELRHILRQGWPAPEVDDLLEFERRMQQGQRFHQLVHQHQIGIPAATLQKGIHDPEVHTWFQIYLDVALPQLPQKLYPERVLTIPLLDGAYGLLAKVDLLAFDDTVQIIDWKTSRHIPKPARLAKRLQTIVYRYVVARGVAHLNNGQPIDPERIEMIYWYAAEGGETIRLSYDADQMQADETYLLGLIDEIRERTTFALTDDERRCRFCTYRSLCDRGRAAGSFDDYESALEDDYDPDAFEIDIDQIAEIEF